MHVHIWRMSGLDGVAESDTLVVVDTCGCGAERRRAF